MINVFLRGCLIFFVLMVSGGCAATKSVESRTLLFDTQVYVGGVPLKVVVFDTPGERELGLMHVEKLPEGTGALFVFEEERSVALWMKNMKFAIDMLFFDKHRNLIHKMEMIQPCKSDKCDSHSVGGVKYVLEIPRIANVYRRAKIGDRLIKNPQI